VEVNRPFVVNPFTKGCCECCCVRDDVEVIYFDQSVAQNIDKAGLAVVFVVKLRLCILIIVFAVAGK